MTGLDIPASEEMFADDKEISTATVTILIPPFSMIK
jgi:hypothetical protein